MKIYVKADSNTISVDSVILYLCDAVWRDSGRHGVNAKPGSDSFKLFGDSYKLIIDSDTAKLYEFENRKPVLIDTLQITPETHSGDIGNWILKLIY